MMTGNESTNHSQILKNSPDSDAEFETARERHQVSHRMAAFERD